MRCFSAISQFEPAALLGGIVQFAKTVGELDAAGIELETLGDARVTRRPRQRRLHRRIFVENGGAADAEMALDPLDQNPAENIAPGVVRGGPDAGLLRRPREGVAIRLAAGQRRQKIDAGITREGLGDGEPLGLGEWIGRCGRERSSVRLPAASAATREDRGAVRHQRLDTALRRGTIRSG